MAKFCKKCGFRMDEDKGVCPQCGYVTGGGKPPKKKRWGLRITLITLAVLLVIGIAVVAAAKLASFKLPLLDGLFADKKTEKADGDSDGGGVAAEDEIPEIIQPTGSAYVPDDNSVSYDEESGIAYINNIVLIFFNDGTSEREIDRVIDSIDGIVVGSLPIINQYQVKVKESTLEELTAICDKLKENSCVFEAYYDEAFELSEDMVPNDPWEKGKKETWSEDSPNGSNWWVEAIDAISAWDRDDKLKHITVGVVDAGVDNGHYDLKKVVTYVSPVNNKDDHGTHVSGIIAAEDGNGKGISGLVHKCNLVTWDWKLTALQELLSGGWSTTNQILAGTVILVESGAKVVNLSAGQTGSISGTYRSGADVDRQGSVASTYLARLISKGYDFVVVQSAGNGNASHTSVDASYNGLFSSINERNCVTYANVTAQDVLDRVIVVGAAERDGNNGYTQRADSNAGSRVDICAPGTDVYSTVPGGVSGKCAYMSGTSMAAPIVTGVAAMVWAANSALSGAEVKRIVCENTLYDVSDNTSSQHPLNNSYRLVNANMALEAAIGFEAEREIILTLDVSGSMSGTPIEETRNAARKFVETALDEDSGIAVVTYDDRAYEEADPTQSKKKLTDAIDRIGTGGGTSIDAGLTKAYEMLNEGKAKRKIIVLMSDGMPNEGRQGSELISFADEIKDDGIYIYTLGFFESLNGTDKTAAQSLMESIASEGCHYEVADADDLVFFFEDIAAQVSGQKYIYIRIACPVDVSVKHDGERLNSDEDHLSTRTGFGTLTFEQEEEPEEGRDNRIKILRLKDDGADYDIEIKGNGKGSMTYTIGYMDENGEYSDLRSFEDIDITKRTEITTVAKANPKSDIVLKVDTDGDGKTDETYKAGPNEDGELVDYTWIIYLIAGIAAAIILLILILMGRRFFKKLKKSYKVAPKKAKLPTRPTVYTRKTAPGKTPPRPDDPSKAKFCKHCGEKLGENDRICGNCGTPV